MLPTIRANRIEVWPDTLSPQTQAYVHRRITEGLSKQEILRCLKRYIVRDVCTALRADFAALAPRPP